MPRKKSATLTEGEFKIMDILWQMGRASVKEVTDVLNAKQKTAYTTVMTMLGILVEKGYVDHEKKGRAFIYWPLIDRKQARSGVAKHIVRKFFNNSPALLVQNLIEDENLSEDDLEALKKRIEAIERGK